MKKIVMLLAALLALSASGCASREEVPLPPSSSAPESRAESAVSLAPESGDSASDPGPAAPAGSARETPREKKEPWEEDASLRPPLERKEVPADTASVTIATDAESYAIADELAVRYTITNDSTQVLTYLGKYVIERQAKDGDWQKVDYPEGREPQDELEIVVLNPGESREFTAPLYRDMLEAGAWRVRCGVWVYDYEVNTGRDTVPDKERGRFDLTAAFAVA